MLISKIGAGIAVSAALVLLAGTAQAQGGWTVVTASFVLTLIARLVDFHVDFALSRPDLIRVQDRDIENLPEADARKVRRLQRRYVEYLVRTRELSPEEARVRAVALRTALTSTEAAV